MSDVTNTTPQAPALPNGDTAGDAIPQAKAETPFKLVTTPAQTLAAYLKERVSGDADAPHRGLPFITEKDILRVKPSDWIDWFTSHDAKGRWWTGDEPSKTQALKVLKDAGMVQRVYPLPASGAHPELKGKSFGLYTAAAPSGTKTLPRVPAAQRSTAPKPATDKPAAKDAPADGPRKVAASKVKVGDQVAQAKKGPFREVKALSPGETAVRIEFTEGGNIRPRKVTEVWVA